LKKKSYLCTMEIANIVSTSKINVGPEFNVVESMDEIVYADLPTLIVGYDMTCDLYGEDNLNVLNRKIKKNIFWTFKRNEKRQICDVDIEDFIRYSYRQYTNKLNYVDLDLIQDNPIKIRKIVKKLLSLSNPISYETENNVIYIYSDNIIFGLDLNVFEYLELDIEKIRKKVKDNSSVFLSETELLIEYANHLDRLDNDIKLIPFLYSINPNE